MAYTSFGEFVRILRIRHHEVMGDMARKLGVKLPFLSAVENGKKNVPVDWADRLTELYSLSTEDRAELEEAIADSKTQTKVSLVNAGAVQRRAALRFARSFDSMDEATAERILELLNKQGAN